MVGGGRDRRGGRLVRRDARPRPRRAAPGSGDHSAGPEAPATAAIVAPGATATATVAPSPLPPAAGAPTVSHDSRAAGGLAIAGAHPRDELALLGAVERQLGAVPAELDALLALARSGASEASTRQYVGEHLATPIALRVLASEWLRRRAGASGAARRGPRPGRRRVAHRPAASGRPAVAESPSPLTRPSPWS